MPRDLAIHGEVRLASGRDWCTLASSGETVRLTASSLRLLRDLMHVLNRSQPAAGNVLRRTGIDVEFRVGPIRIARAGPSAAPGRLARWLRWGELELFPLNLLRAACARRVPGG